MKITNVTAIPLSVARKRKTAQFVPYSQELKILTSIQTCFVKVQTDANLYGTGECTVRETPEAHAAVIEKLLKPVLLGADPCDVEALWTRMFNTLRTRGHNGGIFFEALAGVDCALWDLWGKMQGKPVYKLLGGELRKRVKAYASSVLFGENAPTLARRLVEKGHDQIKLKVGMDFRTDVMNVKGIRDAVGYDVELIADANSAYGTTQAVKLGRHLERYEVKWFEEPVAPDNINGYIELARTLDIPIAAGESHFSKYTFLELMSKRAVDIIQPNISRSGGITECRKILSMAEAFNMQYAPHTGLSGAGCRAATLQLAATIPEDIFLTYEYGIFPHPFGDPILVDPVERFSKGFVDVPDRPGLGLELNNELVEKYGSPQGREIVWDDTRIIE